MVSKKKVHLPDRGGKGGMSKEVLIGKALRAIYNRAIDQWFDSENVFERRLLENGVTLSVLGCRGSNNGAGEVAVARGGVLQMLEPPNNDVQFGKAISVSENGDKICVYSAGQKHTYMCDEDKKSYVYFKSEVI